MTNQARSEADGIIRSIREFDTTGEIMKTIALRTYIVLIFVLALGRVSSAADDQVIEELRKQIAELKERVSQLEKINAVKTDGDRAQGRVDVQRGKARERMKKDAQVYSQKQLREIESLYQVANQKWQTEEGKNSLKELIQKYDKANRTGCALLYLGQMSKGAEKEEYLNRAIADFSDCWYGDGVQVGPFARWMLALHYRDGEQAEKSKLLMEELKTRYPDAIDHQGKPLSEVINVE
ncbi:tol-pal system YbgF family protein [Schlesneria paludicola]|uniref:hypothetical protein n=1 Tax=Schlesneria paludicola TaxID=360056 RepID=UPI00029A0CA9|nr:hypothetical protein [Schlesneria paludicola]